MTKNVAWEIKEKELIIKGLEIATRTEFNNIFERITVEATERYTNVSKELFKEKYYNKLLCLVSDFKIAKSKIEYYMESDRDFSIDYIPSMYIEKIMLFNLFNIDLKDDVYTINRKIKSVLDNKEYKETKKKNTFKFYRRTTGKLFLDEGEKITCKGFNIYVSKQDNQYYMIEEKSGMLICKGTNKAKTIKECKEIINNKFDLVTKSVNRAIEVHGDLPKI